MMENSEKSNLGTAVRLERDNQRYPLAAKVLRDHMHLGHPEGRLRRDENPILALLGFVATEIKQLCESRAW